MRAGMKNAALKIAMESVANRFSNLRTTGLRCLSGDGHLIRSGLLHNRLAHDAKTTALVWARSAPARHHSVRVRLNQYNCC